MSRSITIIDETTSSGHPTDNNDKELSDLIQGITNRITCGLSSSYIQSCLSNIHPNVLTSFHNSNSDNALEVGLRIPQYSLSGHRIVYVGEYSIGYTLLLSQLVGPNGYVLGIINDEQLRHNYDTINSYVQHQKNKVGYRNVEYMTLSELIAQTTVIGYSSTNSKNKNISNSDSDDGPDISVLSTKLQAFDLIVGTGLSTLYHNDKKPLLQSCYELLKEGGELYVTDIYTNKRIPSDMINNSKIDNKRPSIMNALYYHDFLHIIKSIGFIDPRLYDHQLLSTNDQQLTLLLPYDDIQYHITTYRLPKISTLESSCEDYGQSIIYHGTINCMEHYISGSDRQLQNHQKEIPSTSTLLSWKFDCKNIFEMGKMHRVCGNTYRILKEHPIISSHFTYIGTFDKHYDTMDSCFDKTSVLPISSPKLDNHDDITRKKNLYNEYMTFVRELIAEAFGTFIITQFGTASVMSAVIASALIGLFQVAVIWFIAVTLAILITAHISGAHLNPAVSIAFAIIRPSNKFNYWKVIPYSLAQLLGAFIASLLNYGLYASRIQDYETVNNVPRDVDSANTITTAKCFGQYKASTVTVTESFFAELFGTFMLAVVIFAATNPNNKALGSNTNALVPAFMIGLSVSALIGTLAPISQGGFNPARDFGPRLVAWMFGWNPTIVFRDAWLYIVAPIIGAPLGGIFVDYVLFPPSSPQQTQPPKKQKSL